MGRESQKVAPVCGHFGHNARGLCTACYRRIEFHGQLDQYPTKPVMQPDFTHVLTAHQALTVEEIEFGTVSSMGDASRLGMSPAALERTLYRAKRPDLVRRLKGGK